MKNFIPASQINYGVYFQFSEKGAVCCANHRYIKNGLILKCFINNRFHSIQYKTVDNASKRLLILREDISGSAKQQNRLAIIKK